MDAPYALHPDTIGRLRALIGLNVESAKGFRRAAEWVRNPAISQTLRLSGDTHQALARELHSLVASVDGPWTDAGGYRGAVHRWWLAVRGMIDYGREQPLLAAARSGEDQVKRLYEEALGGSLCRGAAEVLRRQHATLMWLCDRLQLQRERSGAR